MFSSWNKKIIERKRNGFLVVEKPLTQILYFIEILLKTEDEKMCVSFRFCYSGQENSMYLLSGNNLEFELKEMFIS